MTDEIAIHAATSADMAALCQLYLAFHEFHVRGLPERLLSLGDPAQFDCAGLIADLGRLLGADDAALLVAERHGAVVGFAEVYLRQTEPERPVVARSYAQLQSLFVAEPERRRGIGRRLLDAAQGWARARGASELQLDVWEFPAGPLDFYERAGYRTLRRTLVRPLDPA